jgi:hypothetical protein
MKNINIFKNISISISEDELFTKIDRRYSPIKNDLIVSEEINISIEHIDIIKNEETFFINKSMGVSKNSVLILSKNKKLLEICNSICENNIKICVEKKFNTDEIFNIFEDILFFKLLQNKIIPIHSSGIFVNKKGYLFPSYGGVGKTRILLEACKKEKDLLVSDEWCFLQSSTIVPFKNEVLLMDYDIISYPNRVSAIDYIRTIIYRLMPGVIAKLIIKKIFFGIQYKKIKLNNVGKFSVHQVQFVMRSFSKKIKKEVSSVENISLHITNNFLHEKNSLLELEKLNNISNFDKKSDLMAVYKSELIEVLSDVTCFNLFIPFHENNFSKIYKVAVNDTEL